MRFSKLTLGALCLAVLAGCSDKKTDIDNPEGPQGSGEMAEMTPEESKTFLQDAAVDFLNKFKPEDQKAFIELAAYYESEYAGYELPDNFYLDDEEDEASISPRSFMRELANAAKGDIDALTRAANSVSYTIGFDRFAGIYEPVSSREEWEKTGDSKDVVFKFNNRAGQSVEMKVSQSGGVSELDFSESDWDYEYNPGTGSYEDKETVYTYYLSIPKNITATLTENGTQLASTTVVSSIDVKGHTLSADVNATLMNLKVTAKLEGNDNKVESRTELFADNQKIATAYATVEGNGLCDLDRYKELEDLEEDMFNNQLGKMLKKGDCGLDFLGKVQVYGQMTYYEKLPLDLDGSYDGWEYDKDKTAAQKAVQAACDRLNKNIKAQLRYNNTKTDQATILFQPGFEDWDYMWEYYTDCVLLFPDNTKYSMETYFSKFTNVTGKFDSLVDAYLNMWKQAKK